MRLLLVELFIKTFLLFDKICTKLPISWARMAIRHISICNLKSIVWKGFDRFNRYFWSSSWVYRWVDEGSGLLSTKSNISGAKCFAGRFKCHSMNNFIQIAISISCAERCKLLVNSKCFVHFQLKHNNYFTIITSDASLLSFSLQAIIEKLSIQR